MELVLGVLLLLLGIVILVVIHVWIVERMFGGVFINDGVSQIHTTPTVKISAKDLNMLPCFEFMEEKGKDNGECVVCLETLQAGDMCRFLPNCSHSFHAQCVDLWLLKKPFCPICRTIVKPPKNCIVRSHVPVEVA